MTERSVETGYLAAGAGALGMGFADTLLEHSDADIVLVDRRHGPGGHWLDAYPFVELHQPSMTYGVDSTPLGRDRLDDDGRDAGFYERADRTQICSYFDEVLRRRLLASGRVRFFAMSDYLGDRRFTSRLTGEVTDVSVRRGVVDATYMASRVPATDPPPFEVADGATCVPVGDLTSVSEPPGGYVLVGGGKTAMDAACWLLDLGTPPSAITWIRPRDPWLSNRAYFQPGDGVLRTFEGIVLQLEAVVACDSIEQAFAELEERQVMLRLDPSVEPSMLRGATASVAEVEQVRRIDQVVRLGHVQRIDADRITLDKGSIVTGRDRLHVHCASPGLGDNPPTPIFADGALRLQPVSRSSLCLSAGLLGVVEGSGRPTAEKNRLCPPNPWFDTPFGWVRHLLVGMQTELGWRDVPDLVQWLEASRLNLMKGLTDQQDRARVTDLQGRFLTALFEALPKLDGLAAHASASEWARMYASPAAP